MLAPLADGNECALAGDEITERAPRLRLPRVAIARAHLVRLLHGVAAQVGTTGTFQARNAHGELDAPLPDHHRLRLHPSEGFRIAMLGPDAGDLVEGVVQLLPLRGDLPFCGSQLSNGFDHLCCS